MMTLEELHRALIPLGTFMSNLSKAVYDRGKPATSLEIVTHLILGLRAGLFDVISARPKPEERHVKRP